MPTYLENVNGIPGGTLLTGGTQPNETLYFRSTSDADKGGIFWGTTFYDDGSDSMVINRGTTLPINTDADMFANVTPRFEIRTGSEAAGYQQLMVMRNDSVGVSSAVRRLGFLFKLSTESDETESNKSGGVILESTTDYSLLPRLSMVIANTALLTVFPSGNAGIGTNLTDPGYKLYVGGTLHATGALTAPSLATTGAITAGGALTAASVAATGAITGASLATTGAVTAGGALTAAGLLSANGGLALTVGSDATGDMYYRNSSGQLARVGIGSSGQVLSVNSGLPSWGSIGAMLNAPTILSVTTGIPGRGTGATALYTVPTGKTLIVTGVYVRGGGGAVGAIANIGDSVNGAASIYAGADVGGVVGEGDLFQYPVGGIYNTVSGGATVNFNITVSGEDWGPIISLDYTVTLVGILQ